MSETSLEQTTNPENSDKGEPGELHIAEKVAEEPVAPLVSTAVLEAKIPAPQGTSNRAGTIEHLAARRQVTPLDAGSAEVKQRLNELRTEITSLLTDLRWGGASIEETAEQLIPLLNVGPLQQWIPVLVPHILEIDRAGNLLPVWMRIIEQEDARDLPADANPGETMIGRARRIAILMLGNYKAPEMAQFLGKLAIDPASSLYATQALIKQVTTVTLQILVSALKDAEGWAKVDVVEACLSLQLSRLHELILASGIERANGLESYIAIPVYRSIPLERYLRGGNSVSPRLSQQAALIFGQVLQDSLKANPGSGDGLPIVFEQEPGPLARALFESTRNKPDWQHALALHRLAVLLGRYWAEISRGAIQDPRIIEPVYTCLPLMPEVERWMNGPGRDVLLEALANPNEEGFTPVVRVLGEMREPRAIAVLISRIEATTSVHSREQAIRLGHMCDALGRLGDRRAIQPMLQLIGRILDAAARAARPKRRDNLTAGDADIPGSIVYAAVIRALGEMNDRSSFDFVVRAANDFDPFVRIEVLEALKRLDPGGEDVRSQAAVREALNDPRESTVRTACKIVAQYHDTRAVPTLQRLVESRPEVAAAAYDALRQLGE